MAEEENGGGAGGHHKLSKNQVKIMAAAVAGIVVYAYWRSRQSAAAAAAATPTDTTGGNGYAQGTDPYGYSGIGMDPGYGSGTGGYYYDGSGSYNGTVGTIATNADWFQAALQGAENAGYDAGTASVALSLYLAHQALTATQQQIVQVGLAAAGNPPSGTYTIITAPSSPGTVGGSGGAVPTNVTVKNFARVNANTTWDAFARSYNAFGGNGQALYQYNLLPGKHGASTYPELEKNGVGKLTKGNLVALPVAGKQIQLPVVGVVTT